MIWVDWDGGWGRLGPGKFGYPTQSFTFMMIMMMIITIDDDDEYGDDDDDV